MELWESLFTKRNGLMAVFRWRQSPPTLRGLGRYGERVAIELNLLGKIRICIEGTAPRKTTKLIL